MIYKAEVIDTIEEYYSYRLMRYESIVDAEILRNKQNLKDGKKIEIDFSWFQILSDSDKKFLLNEARRAMFSHYAFLGNVMILGI